MLKFLLKNVLFIVFIWALIFGYQTFFLGGSGKGDVRIEMKQEPSRSQAEIKNHPFTNFPNSVLKTRVYKDDKLIQEATYEITENLFRKSPVDNPESTKHAVFAGSSNIFGIGLKDNETLPYLFQKKTSEYSEYNLGFQDGGLQHILKHQEMYPWEKVIRPPQGYFFYFFTKDHINRFHNTLNYIAWANAAAPVYGIEDGRAISQGQVKDNKNYKYMEIAKKLFIRKAMVSYFHRDVFLEEQAIADFLLAVEELKRRYEKSFPNGKFIFVFHPLADSSDIKDQFKYKITEKKITVLDGEIAFKDLLKQEGSLEKKYLLSWDDHPNQLMNDWFAGWLVAEVKKIEEASILPPVAPVNVPVADPLPHDGTMPAMGQGSTPPAPAVTPETQAPSTPAAPTVSPSTQAQ